MLHLHPDGVGGRNQKWSMFGLGYVVFVQGIDQCESFLN
ncbi:MAG: hypothetical protein ACI92Z_001364 [Paracoccaceae bacterium]|jgi:hypothetical protein